MWCGELLSQTEILLLPEGNTLLHCASLHPPPLFLLPKLESVWTRREKRSQETKQCLKITQQPSRKGQTNILIYFFFFPFFLIPVLDTGLCCTLSKQSEIGQFTKTGRGKISRQLFLSPSFQEKKISKIKGADFLLMFGGRHWSTDCVSVWQVIPNNIQVVQVRDECGSVIFRLMSQGWELSTGGVCLPLLSLPSQFCTQGPIS